MYSARLLDHFEHPRNAGDLPDADSTVTVENPACGDVLRLAIRMKDGVIDQVRFKAQGCVPAMACGSAVTELILGKSIAEASTITVDDVVAAVEGVPPASGHAADLTVDAVKILLLKVSAERPNT